MDAIRSMRLQAVRCTRVRRRALEPVLLRRSREALRALRRGDEARASHAGLRPPPAPPRAPRQLAPHCRSPADPPRRRGPQGRHVELVLGASAEVKELRDAGIPLPRDAPTCCVTPVTDDRKFCGARLVRSLGESEECDSRGISSFARRPWPPFLSWPSLWRSAARRARRRLHGQGATSRTPRSWSRATSSRSRGAPVGKVTNIDLTPDGQAQVTLKIKDDYAPLRRGTLATVRQASLSGVANRYIDLRMAPQAATKIPDGGVIEQDSHDHRGRPRPDLQHLRPRDAQGAAGRHQGLGQPVQGQGQGVQRGPRSTSTRRSPPRAACSASSTATRRCSSASSSPPPSSSPTSPTATTTSPASSTTSPRRRPRSATSSQALAESIAPLPAVHAPRQHDVREPARRARRPRPARRRLQAGREEAAPVPRRAAPARPRRAADAATTSRDIAQPPGAANDLIELTQRAAGAARRRHAQGHEVNGKERDGAFPASPKALKGNTPELAFVRPYTPDLLGWFDDFSHSGIYDALGAASRVGIHANARSPARATGQLDAVPPELRGTALEAGARRSTRTTAARAAASTSPTTAPARTSRRPTSTATRRQVLPGK